MNRYAMSQGHLCRTNRTIITDAVKTMPRYAKADVLLFDKRPNPYWGGYDYGFEVYTNKTLNKAKLLNLFFKLKRECQNVESFDVEVKLDSEFFLNKG